MGANARGMSVVSTADAGVRGDPVMSEVPAWAVYTCGQMLKKGPQNRHFRHFSAPSTQLPGAVAQSASRSVRSGSGLSWAFLGSQHPSWLQVHQNCHDDFRAMFTISRSN